MSSPPSPGATVELAILTSRGPSLIIGLKEMDARLGRSTVCLNGTTTQAGIASDYNAFVRLPTGVIERLYQKPAWRLDVSAPIDAGASWQCAALAAHGLHVAGRLYLPLGGTQTQKPDLLILLTGTIRSIDLAIGPVGELEAKASRALQLMSEARSQGRPVLIVMPPGSLEEIYPATRAEIDALGVEMVEVDHADALFRRLKLPAPELDARASADPVQPRWSGNPYRGLDPFGPEHRPIFFGRARAREEVVELLRTSAARDLSFVLVHGRSGAGKSSLVAAGVAGDILNQAGESGSDWLSLTLRLGTAGHSSALDMLTHGLTGLLGLAPETFATDELAPQAIRQLQAGPRPRTLLLILDQLEQPLASETEDELRSFGSAIRALVRSGRVWVLATLRSDQLETLDRAPDLAWLARDGRSYRLDPPNLFELTEIVLQPAALAGLRFAPGPGGESLPATLAEIALRSPDSLPLLQMVLARLATQAGPDGVIPFAAYARLGGFEGAIGRSAEEVVETLLADGLSEAALQGLLAGLVRIDPGTGRALARGLTLGPDTSQDLRRAIATLVDGRIVTPEAEGTDSIRLSHEALIMHWPRLASLVTDLRDDLSLRDQIEAGATQWKLGGQTDEDLLSAPLRLARMEDLATRSLTPLGQNAKNWLTASRQLIGKREADRAKRLRLAIIGLSILATIFAALGTIALFQWRYQVQATAKAEVEAALRASGPAKELMAQGRSLDALLVLHEALETLVGSGPVEATMHDTLRSLLRGVAGQYRYEIPNNLAAYEIEGTLFVQDPLTGEVQLVEPKGLVPTSVNLPGSILHWDYVPDLGTFVLVRRLNDRLLFNAFDPATLRPGKSYADLNLGRADVPQLRVQIGPDGLVLVNGYRASDDYFFEGTSLRDPVKAWVVDLSSSTEIGLESIFFDHLMNDKNGRSYVFGNGDARVLQFDKVTGTMIARSAVEREQSENDVYYTCFRRYLDDPDLELMIARMKESREDSLENTSHLQIRPECRLTGEWLMTLTGRTSGSGFWKDVAIYEREQLLDRDGSLRDDGLYWVEEGAARASYSTLSTVALPSLSATDDYDPIFVSFDGRTLIGSFSSDLRTNTTEISASALLSDSIAAWVEAPTKGEMREVILLDVYADDPFVMFGKTPSDPIYRAQEALSETEVSFPDGSRFDSADLHALGLVGQVVLPVPGKTQLIVSDSGLDIWRVSRSSDGSWEREIFFKSDRPVMPLTISNDGALLVFALAGATLGSGERAVVSLTDGKIVEYLDMGPQQGSYWPFGEGSFVEFHGSEGLEDVLTQYIFPDYAGYLEAVNDAIDRLCSSSVGETCR